MANRPDMAENAQDRAPFAPVQKQQHTGVGMTLYLGVGLIVFTGLMLVLALIMIGFTGPLGEP